LRESRHFEDYDDAALDAKQHGVPPVLSLLLTEPGVKLSIWLNQGDMSALRYRCGF
jgi:hypothetical protein